MNKIAQNLQMLQSKSGQRKKEKASFYGVKESTYSSYISGRATPPIDLLLDICDKEMVSMDWLCGRDAWIGDLWLSDVGNLFYRLWESYSCYSIKVVCNKGNTNKLDEISVNIRTSDTKLYGMMEKIQNHFAIMSKIDKEQSEILRKSIIEEYKGDIII